MIYSFNYFFSYFDYHFSQNCGETTDVTRIQQGKKLNFDNSKCLMDCLSFIIFIYSGKLKIYIFFEYKYVSHHDTWICRMYVGVLDEIIKIDFCLMRTAQTEENNHTDINVIWEGKCFPCTHIIQYYTPYCIRYTYNKEQ